jgi:hypothetical protein
LNQKMRVEAYLQKYFSQIKNSQIAPMFSILSKITRKNIIREKIERSEAGLYFYLVFPIAFAFLVTFMLSRIFNIISPDFYLVGLAVGHVHHFAYGFFILAISGYLALIFDGPRAKYLISLLHGFGLGLAFDEFGLWINLRDDDLTRWNYDGFLIIIGFFFLILSAQKGTKMLRFLWPFRPK